MKLIYISGKFSDEDRIHGTEKNIVIASECALACWRKGWAVICPHKNTKDYQHVKDLHYETWINGVIEMLRRCDAILMLPGWEDSTGATIEHDIATSKGISIFYAEDGIPQAED
jgi:hypothetical protein